MRNLLPFPTTYLWETAFSQLLILQNKYRNKLDEEDDLRCAISTTEPRIELLAKKTTIQGVSLRSVHKHILHNGVKLFVQIIWN